MVVPLTYTIDKFAPLPYEARPVYAIGSLLGFYFLHINHPYQYTYDTLPKYYPASDRD